MSTRWPQRIISESDLRFAGYVRSPHEAKPTALGLWPRTDMNGRRELDVEVMAAELYPLDDPGEAADRVELHILMLEESGFLTTYAAEGREWVALRRPLRGDRRGRVPIAPPPPGDMHASAYSRESVAMERERARGRERAGASESARARARERVREEDEARSTRWAEWENEQDHRASTRPERPLLLEAPPIGCPDHPNNSTTIRCGPCGTQRKRHDEWVARHRYEEQLAVFEEGVDDDEPF